MIGWLMFYRMNSDLFLLKCKFLWRSEKFLNENNFDTILKRLGKFSDCHFKKSPVSHWNFERMRYSSTLNLFQWKNSVLIELCQKRENFGLRQKCSPTNRLGEKNTFWKVSFKVSKSIFSKPLAWVWSKPLKPLKPPF